MTTPGMLGPAIDCLSIVNDRVTQLEARHAMARMTEVDLEAFKDAHKRMMLALAELERTVYATAFKNGITLGDLTKPRQ